MGFSIFPKKTSPDSPATLLKQSAEAVFCFDPSHRITFFNDAAERLWGHRKVELLGKPVATIIPGWRTSDDLSTGKQEGYSTLPARRSDGASVDVVLTVSPLELKGRRSFMATVRPADLLPRIDV